MRCDPRQLAVCVPFRLKGSVCPPVPPRRPTAWAGCSDGWAVPGTELFGQSSLGSAWRRRTLPSLPSPPAPVTVRALFARNSPR